MLATNFLKIQGILHDVVLQQCPFSLLPEMWDRLLETTRALLLGSSASSSSSSSSSFPSFYSSTKAAMKPITSLTETTILQLIIETPSMGCEYPPAETKDKDDSVHITDILSLPGCESLYSIFQLLFLSNPAWLDFNDHAHISQYRCVDLSRHTLGEVCRRLPPESLVSSSSISVNKTIVARIFTFFSLEDIKNWKFDARSINFPVPNRDGSRPYDHLASYYAARVAQTDFFKFAGLVCDSCMK